MKTRSTFLTLGWAAACGGSALFASTQSAGSCDVIRILPDGREIRSKGDAASFVHRDDRTSSASGAARSSGRSSASSSVSVSSSSSSRGGGHAKAVTSYTDEQGHQVTTVRDENGCRITVDERG